MNEQSTSPAVAEATTSTVYDQKIIYDQQGTKEVINYTRKPKHTKEEVKAWYADLRKQWQEAKALAESKKYEAIFQEALRTGIQVSYTGFVFTKVAMERQNLEGLPYIDAKTFSGWKQSGFKVRKGEHSKITGLTWLRGDKENEQKPEENTTQGYSFPKAYYLFHRSQVEAIA